jgi:hypothetical protein
MATNNIINSPLPTALAKGGTNANLTASNGGIFYSTASAGAILAGTATANCPILSGSSTAPLWATATYPATITANQLLYSSSNNVIGGVTTANSASLVTNSSGIPSWSSSMTNGQVIIGSTSGTPTAATLTAGTNVAITNSSGNITISSGLGGNWVWIATQTASNSASLNFNSQFSSIYIAYRLVLNNILPAASGAGIQLYLRLGTGAGPTYITSGYIYQILDVNTTTSNTHNLTYDGYTGSGFGQVQITDSHGNGITNSSTYGGVCGNIDLFITAGSSNVANGRSFVSSKGTNLAAFYVNTTCSFQQPAANFTSVQLLMSTGNITSGSAYLYGLTI